MRILILGAGPAGLTAAERLRALAPGVDVTLVSAEPTPPYSPPAMADCFLTGREEPLFWKGRDVCERLGVDYRSGVAVRAVDPSERRVTLDDGSTLAWDRLLIATGARLHAPVDGLDLDRVFDFKSLTAARSLVAAARQGHIGRAIIVGAGFIGVEVALLLRGLGLEVIQLERFDRVMPRMLDAETAGMVQEALRRRGVDLRLESEARAFVGRGAAEAVELVTGERLAGDVFVAATGVEPNVGMLAGSGIDVGWGIRVDDTLATNVPDVFAAGDVAETRDRLSGERWVHAIFPNAVAQGELVAANLLGHDLVYEGAESWNSLKHLGLPVVAMGMAEGEETLRWRQGDRLRTLVLEEGRLVGFRLVGDVHSAGVLRSIMLRRLDVRPWADRLLDPRFGYGQSMLDAVAA